MYKKKNIIIYLIIKITSHIKNTPYCERGCVISGVCHFENFHYINLYFVVGECAFRKFLLHKFVFCCSAFRKTWRIIM